MSGLYVDLDEARIGYMIWESWVVWPVFGDKLCGSLQVIDLADEAPEAEAECWMWCHGSSKAASPQVKDEASTQPAGKGGMLSFCRKHGLRHQFYPILVSRCHGSSLVSSSRCLDFLIVLYQHNRKQVFDRSPPV